jgi:hypothetical protein
MRKSGNRALCGNLFFLARNSGSSAAFPFTKDCKRSASLGEILNTRGLRLLLSGMCRPDLLFLTTIMQF